ncbi:MAG: GNAT family N-acetyltransferase [Bacteroidales bacterium]
MNNRKEQVKRLWQTVFDTDSAEFVDYYFGNIYDDNDCFSRENNKGVVVSALQSLPYPFCYYRATIGMRYISGASTYQEHRGVGLMGQLMRDSIVGAYASGDALMTLIPANSGLYGYYAQFGFAPIFKKSLNTHQYSNDDSDGYTIQSISDVDRVEIYKYLHYEQGYKLATVYHSESGFEHICFDYNRRVYALFDSANDIRGVAFVNEDSRVNMIIGDRDKQVEIFLNLICRWYGLRVIDYLVADDNGNDWGMGRVINAEKMLSIYAKANPKFTAKLSVTDAIIDENNCVFEVTAGEVKVSDSAIEATAVTIQELAEILFKGTTADLSLMLE